MTFHVLQLGPVPPPEGGVSRHLMSVRDRVIAAGGRCSVIATSKSSGTIADVSYPANPLAFVRSLASTPSDIVHLHVGGDVTSRVMRLAAAVAMFGRGKKVLTMHSGGFPSSELARDASSSGFASWVFRRFDSVIAVNDEIRDVFVKFGVDRERLSVILPYELKRPDPTAELPSDVAAFCTTRSPLLVSVGGLEHVYDPLFQINAMPAIIERFPNAALAIVGSGPLLGECRDAIERLGMTDRVMLTGNIDHAATLKLIDHADAMLRTTHFDGDAISVRESLYIGTPVVATDNKMRPAGVHLIDCLEASVLVDTIANALSSPVVSLKTDAPSPLTEVIDLYSKLISNSK